MASKIFVDTSECSKISYKDIIQLGEKKYSIIGDAKEMRFGVEDPKFWVKRAFDMDSREKKIIKLVFYESFITTFAGIKINCFRDPEKEARILRLTKGHPLFMQGEDYQDAKENNVRVLDVVRGKNLFVFIESMEMPHEEYFYTIVPGILKHVVKAFEAIMLLHNNGFRHGDIRNDHLIIESRTGNYVWIDFDYDFEASESPFALDLFGMGNILLYVIGKGFHLYYSIANDRKKYGDLVENINTADFSVLDPSRFLNLRKMYPYIPKLLNDILMHFSESAEIYYESAYELTEELKRCLYSTF